MTRATSRATSARVVLPEQGTASASQPVSPQHVGTQAALWALRAGSGFDLVVHRPRGARIPAQVRQIRLAGLGDLEAHQSGNNVADRLEVRR